MGSLLPYALLSMGKGITLSELPDLLARPLNLQLADQHISLWIKLAYTLFVLILIPIYWKYWGPANFLWFSDVALFVSVAALWLESSYLASMMAIGVLLPELYWNLELVVRLLTGYKLAGLTDYMWNPRHPLLLRLLSLFHVVLPVLLILMLLKWGYTPEALYAQTLLAWGILFLCYKLTQPSANINWVFGPGNTPQYHIPSKYYLMLMMAAYPLLIFIPTHYLLNWFFA
ncbi:hypothetical protein [Cesiribacter andamanensis]|uniref:Membrane-associated protein n=1 Tax=Cesiribacter andamanensis AMV16 TaxID=1279009 RepID=M7N862_9BACT|nr:hypothetical protein [Cesiribacter andamanensis]EMR04763.1 hypothetical protein ADICEAN_00034 [Cesiribacter andamanensis AMV16]